MASGDRDVKLVIKAKNEASKALDAVSSALSDLTKAQVGVQKGSEKTEGTLTELGSALAKLNQQIGGVSTLDRLANSMERAAGSVAKLEGSITSLTADQAQLAAELQVTENAMAQYTAQAAQLKSTLDAQSATAKKARADLSALNAEVKAGESALSQSVKDSRSYETQLQKLESRLTNTRQKHRELTQELLNAETPSQRLVKTFETTDAALNKQVEALAKARAGYAANANATKDIEASLARLRVAQTESAAASETARVAQEATAASLKDVGRQVRETEKSLSTLKTTALDNSAALERQDKALADAKQQLVAVESAARQADVALEKIGGTVRQRLLRSLVDSQKALVDYRLEWQRATQAVSAAVASGQSAANPSPELKANLEVAKASKAAYQELQIAIQSMRTAVREAGTDVTALASAQQTFVAAMDRVRTKSAQVTAAQQQQAAASKQAGAAAVNAANQQAGAYNRVAGAVDQMGNASRRAGSALGEMEGRGRQALSWAQRLRSEVIALATAYVGLYAAIDQLRGVTRTYMEIEAAQSRMSVAFNGNAAIVSREFRFLQEEATRLGVDIRVLAAEYSKLAVATKGTALEGEPVRKIFTSMTEAFRVNKLSSAQMELAFNAVTQIVNKQAVSMEELRQQLGEKLPGAMTLAAKAMGLTGKEFNKLVASGNLAADEFLPRFAEALDETFGAQLPDALKSLSAEFGRFGNEITKAQLKVANAGFIEGLREGLESLTAFFQSSEGQKFFENLGAAAGGLVKILAAIPKYIEEITFVLSLLVGMRAYGAIQGLGDRFSKLQTVMKPLPAAIAATTTATNALTVAGGRYVAATTAAIPLNARLAASFTGLATTTRAAVAGMTAARAGAVALSGTLTVLRGAFALLGGIPGLIVTGLSFAFTAWMTGTEDVIDATEEHQRQMTALLDSYSQAKDKAGDWASAVKGVSLAGAEQTLDDLRAGLEAQLVPLAQEIAGKLGGTIALGRGLLGDTGKQIAQLTEDLVAGRISVTNYADALDKIYKANPSEEIKEVIRAADGLLNKARDSEKALAEQGIVVQELGGNVEELQPLIDALGLSMEKLAEDAGLAGDGMEKKLVDPAQRLAEELDRLKEKVPSLADELKLLEQVKEIDEILKTAEAIEGLDKTSEAYLRLVATAKQAKLELQAAFDEKQFKDSFDLLSSGGTAIEQSAALLRKREGFQATAKYDVNAYRAGFGSDTVTLADGSIHKITQGMSVSVADANRDLVRRIGEFQGVIKGQIGEQRFAEFNPQQQAVLTSVAYNYGSLPQRIIEAVRTGSSEEIATAIRGLQTDNQGVNAGRRREEAYLFENAGRANAESTAKDVDESLKNEERRVEQADQYRERLTEQLALKAQDAEMGKQATLQEEINLAIAKEEINAKKAGTSLTEAEKQKITETTTVLYERKAAEQAITAEKKRQEEAEQRINLLNQARRDILQQMETARDSGNTGAYTALEAELASVDAQLTALIDKQLQFWDAAKGGPDSEKATAAIANLNTLKGAMVNVGNQGILTTKNIGQMFGQTLLNGANNFLAKIRETGDVFGSLKEAFQQFASDFLLQLAQMIIKQAIFNALQSMGGGGFFGAAAGAVGQAHTGGIAGYGLQQRQAAPGWFNNAVRYHSGGVAGLKPNEVPTILEKGEEVLPESDPRHVNNGGGGAGATEVKIVNAIDAGSFVSAGVEDVQGQKAILNFMRANSSSVKSALGV